MKKRQCPNGLFTMLRQAYVMKAVVWLQLLGHPAPSKNMLENSNEAIRFGNSTSPFHDNEYCNVDFRLRV